jgi:two-component system phosphate regulon response regulator PhoB
MSAVMAPPGAGDRRILVVDDDPLMRTLTSAQLKAAGYRVQSAGEGAAALASTLADPPDLVLLDFMMPGMSGPEVARRMRAQPRMGDVPILLLTGSEREGDIEEGLRSGADDYLIKPIDRRVLVARVQAALTACEERRRAAPLETLT